MAFESHRDNLVGFPEAVFASERRKRIQSLKNEKYLLKAIARDTWKYFENARDKETHIVVDHLRTGEAPLAADYTTPTNIAMDLLATIAGRDLTFISRRRAVGKIRDTIETLGNLERWNGFFYNFYDSHRLFVTKQEYQ